MKIALISDIHGNATALEAVIEDIRSRHADKILVLGDICFRGPKPKESLQLVRELNAEVIKGNADEWVVRGIQPNEVPDRAFTVMTKEREWTHSQLNESDIHYLSELPKQISLTVGNQTVLGFHAVPNDLFENVLPDASDADFREKMGLDDTDADIFCYGHIHRAFIRYINGKVVINLGSVGLPFDGVKKASYALLELDQGVCQASLIKVAYDIDQVLQQVKESDYPNKDFICNVLNTAQI